MKTTLLFYVQQLNEMATTQDYNASYAILFTPPKGRWKVGDTVWATLTMFGIIYWKNPGGFIDVLFAHIMEGSDRNYDFLDL
jgi:hypothetical protein